MINNNLIKKNIIPQVIVMKTNRKLKIIPKKIQKITISKKKKIIYLKFMKIQWILVAIYSILITFLTVDYQTISILPIRYNLKILFGKNLK